MKKRFTKKHYEGFLKHLIFKNVAILASLYRSRDELRSRNLASWTREPVSDMITDLINDIQESLFPVLPIIDEAYSKNKERAVVIKEIHNRLDFLRSTQSGLLECYCVGCEEIKDLK